MRVRRVRLERLPRGPYDLAAAHSFFASRGFLELWREKRGRPVVWVAGPERAPAGFLPGVEFRRGPLSRFVSMPDGCYGGFLPAPRAPAPCDAAARALFDAVARRGYGRCDVFDFRGTVPHPSGYRLERWSTRVVELGGPGWSPPDAKLRSQIRKAARLGVRIERFDWGRHGERFLALAERCAAHHRVAPRYPERFWRALAVLARRDTRVRWGWCEHRGRAACSQVYFVEGDAIQAWQSFMDRGLSFLKANQAMRLAMVREAARDGLRRLNLGATPASAPGLAYYKARWGGAAVPCPAWVRRSKVAETLASLARAARGPADAAPQPVPRHRRPVRGVASAAASH